MARILIAGTGTAVGKTHCSARFITQLQRSGRTPIGLKPVESGFHVQGSDAEALCAAAGGFWRPPLYAFEEPLSPHLAAEREGVDIQLSAVVAWVEAHEAEHPQDTPVVIELAGGLLSPLSLRETNLDLIRALEPCRWVLVTPDRLGVLHDVGAALRAARAEHRLPDAIWLNPIAPDLAAQTNARELRRLWPDLVVSQVNGAALGSELL